MSVMKEINLTITGMRHYYGNGVFHVGDILRCRKEPENAYDAEAIQVLLPVYGKVGYIANSPYTVAKACQEENELNYLQKEEIRPSGP